MPLSPSKIKEKKWLRQKNYYLIRHEFIGRRIHLPLADNRDDKPSRLYRLTEVSCDTLFRYLHSCPSYSKPVVWPILHDICMRKSFLKDTRNFSKRSSRGIKLPQRTTLVHSMSLWSHHFYEMIERSSVVIEDENILAGLYQLQTTLQNCLVVLLLLSIFSRFSCFF